MSPRTLGSMELTARQTELADAALAVIADAGLPGLSFRAVAARAQCSLGSVQKAFPSKERMLAAAFGRLRERSVPLPDGEPGRPTVREWFVELLLRILPLDDERRAAQRQGDAFAQHALDDPDLASAIASSDAHLRSLLASLVARARSEGEVGARVDPDVTAWAVLAVAQGLAAQLLYDPESEDAVRARLDVALAALLR